MKTSYQVRAKRFIQQIFPYISDVLAEPDYCEEAVYAFNVEHNRRVKCCWGATRIALITSDYVVKFDYDKEKARVWGGCMSELRFYKNVDERYKSALCPITKFNYGGKAFYIMPKATRIGEYDNCDIPDWILYHVSDLHRNNIGRYNGRVVAIDYACNSYRYRGRR